MKTKEQKIILYVALAAVTVILLVLAFSSGGGRSGFNVSPIGQSTIVSQAETDPRQNFFPPGVEGNLSAAQSKAFERLSSESAADPWIRAENGIIRFSVTRLAIPDQFAKEAEEKTTRFFISYQDLFNIDDPQNGLVLMQKEQNQDGAFNIQFVQEINKIPVYGSMINVQVSPNGEIISYSGGYIPGKVINNTPVISSQQAEDIIKAIYSIDSSRVSSNTHLVYVDGVVFGEATSSPILAWQVEIVDETQLTFGFVFVDAANGNIVLETPAGMDYQVEVYDNQGKSDSNVSNAIKMMDNNGCISGKNCDEDEINAYTFSKQYEEFLQGKFSGEGYQSDSDLVKEYTHVANLWNVFCLKFGQPQAYWNPWKNIVVFTDGMSKNDVVFHELTHRLVTKEVGGSCKGLCYKGQSGAASESFSDVFAVLIDNGYPNSTWKSIDWEIQDWSVGEDSTIGTRRILSGPPGVKTDDPYHMHDFKESLLNNCYNDYGHVHQNSLILSKAAHLLLHNGNTIFHNTTVRGIGPKKVSQIYYHAIAKHLTQNADFITVRDSIVLSCAELIGKHDITRADCQEVANAFIAVGISKSSAVPVPTYTPGGPGVTNTPISITSPVPINTMSLPIVNASSTVLVFDTSGSMIDYDTSGVAKIEAAQRAGHTILDVISAENQASTGAELSQVGVVGFSTSPYVVSGITSDIDAVRDLLPTLIPTNSTGMAGGLKTGMDLFASGSGQGKQIIILLSDGMPNVSLNASAMDIQQEVIDLAAQAGSSGICVYTVGFGDPSVGIGSIDEEFLKRVAAASGCGAYYRAIDSIELANTYAELRHTSMGSILLNQAGQIAQGQEIDLGVVPVAQHQSTMLFTLNWPGSKLTPTILDPAGVTVDASYPGASISSSKSVVSVIISNPTPGDWKVRILGEDVPEGQTNYKALLSTRQGLVPTETPVVTPTAEPTPAASGGAPLALVAILIAGGLVGVYAYSRSLKRASRSTASAHLRGLSGMVAGKTFAIRDGDTLGRGSRNTIRLAGDPAISRSHAVLRYANGAWFIQDAGSTGGIYVNGQRVKAIRLNPGDQVCLGSQVFVFEAS